MGPFLAWLKEHPKVWISTLLTALGGIILGALAFASRKPGLPSTPDPKPLLDIQVKAQELHLQDKNAVIDANVGKDKALENQRFEEANASAAESIRNKTDDLHNNPQKLPSSLIAALDSADAIKSNKG